MNGEHVSVDPRGIYAWVQLFAVVITMAAGFFSLKNEASLNASGIRRIEASQESVERKLEKVIDSLSALSGRVIRLESAPPR